MVVEQNTEELPFKGSTPSDAALVVTDVFKRHGQGSRAVDVLRGVSLHVARGEVVWVRGRSGSGKSSLIRVAGLLSEATSGTVEIAGARVRHGSPLHSLRRSHVGIVFQNSNLLADLTVLDNVLIASRDTSRSRAVDRLAALGLARIAGRRAKEISGGEAQRAAFCRALINDPTLLLVDEPTSGLDPESSAVIHDQLRDARSRGCAILVASHDVSTATVADRTLTMEDGRLV